MVSPIADRNLPKHSSSSSLGSFTLSQGHVELEAPAHIPLGVLMTLDAIGIMLLLHA